MRDPRGEAAALVGGRDARVLEPSPPCVLEPPWFADDPVAGGEIVPVERNGSTTWASVAVDDSGLRAWCEDRWLIRRPLAPLPPLFAPTLASLHALAEHVIAPARYQSNGKIGLRYTYHGFGTPFFGDNRQVRIEGGALVDGDRQVGITTVAAAASFVGVDPAAPVDVYRPSTDPGLDDALPVDPVAATALGDWFGFCCSLLEQLRAEAGDGDRAGRVQIWPEHFDIAVDLGPEDAGGRANFGGSPGDADHPEPYLYVGPWIQPLPAGPFWNESFGASVSYKEILAGADPLAFLRRGRDLLRA